MDLGYAILLINAEQRLAASLYPSKIKKHENTVQPFDIIMLPLQRP